MSTPTVERAPAPPPHRRERNRAWIVVALIAIVAIVAAGVTVIRARSATDTSAVAGRVPAASNPPTPQAGDTASPASPTASPSPSAAAATSSGTAATSFRFLPLWPFGTADDAVRWQQQALPGGHQAWHLDAGATALAFADTYLGYSEIDRVTGVKVAADEAWVGVAGTSPEIVRLDIPACVLHLARMGSGALSTRPWVVVGSQDRSLTLTTPRYGAVVGTTFTVGGRITGVDESLTVQVRSLSSGPLAKVGGLAAGGQRTPWSATMYLDTSSAQLATVAVSTGGHLFGVEQFAITAVQVKPGNQPKRHATADAALSTLVTNGTFVGACPVTGSNRTVNAPVCSQRLAEHAGQFLYRVGYWQTDNGFFVILAKTLSGRWIVVDAHVTGARIPPELGGPINETG